MRLLTDLNRQGMTVVLVTHEPDIAAWARRKLVFKDGRMVEDTLQAGAEGESNAAGPSQGKTRPPRGAGSYT